jgi:regulatory protein
MPRKRSRPALTRRRLANIAQFYLQRFSTSVANFRRVLKRRAARELGADRPMAEAAGWIDDIVATAIAAGILDDTRFAATVAERGRRLAKPPRRTRASLMKRGVAGDIAARAVPTNAEDEWHAAVAMARRRRLGPFRQAGRTAETDRRDLAVLARAGFAYGVAKRLMTWPAPTA